MVYIVHCNHFVHRNWALPIEYPKYFHYKPPKNIYRWHRKRTRKRKCKATFDQKVLNSFTVVAPKACKAGVV